MTAWYCRAARPRCRVPKLIQVPWLDRRSSACSSTTEQAGNSREELHNLFRDPDDLLHRHDTLVAPQYLTAKHMSASPSSVIVCNSRQLLRKQGINHSGQSGMTIAWLAVRAMPMPFGAGRCVSGTGNPQAAWISRIRSNRMSLTLAANRLFSWLTGHAHPWSLPGT